LTVLSDFLDSVSGGVASSWLALIRVPAVIFWAIGALAWWYGHPQVDVVARVQKLTGTEQILLVALAAAALIGSSALFDQLSRPLLRGLEGYWPRFLAPVSGWLIARAVRRQRTLQEQWQVLDGLDRADQREAEEREAGEPDPRAVAGLALRARRKARLDAQLHGYPDADHADSSRQRAASVRNVPRRTLRT
jgi:hypothetical protein